MNIAQLLQIIQFLPPLINAGIIAADKIMESIKILHPGMTEDELNSIVRVIIINAAGNKALADKDSGVA